MDMLSGKNNLSSFLFDDKYRLHRHLLMQVIMLAIVIGNFFDAPDKLNLSADRIYSAIAYYIFLNMLVYVNAYVLFPFFFARNKVALYVISILAFTILMIVFLIIIQDLFYDIASFRQEEPSVVAVVLSILSSMLGILLFMGGITTFLLFRQWMASNQRIIGLRTATSQSELTFLKSQINPHFLFNMLNNANILVEDEPDTASHILLKLDELLSYQLNDSLQDKVSLDADIRFLSNYLELEKTRRDNFEYEIRKEGDREDIQAAPLLFIPFVENAVKHNGYNEGTSYVWLTFHLQGDQLTFTCRNSIFAKPRPKKEKGGLGLTNIRRRLDLLFGSDYSLEQIKTDKEYTVNLQIKI